MKKNEKTAKSAETEKATETVKTEKPAETAAPEETDTPAALKEDTEATPPSKPKPKAVIKTPDAEVIESPLKLMKAEFHQRAQVIKEQMRNIQNSFITIGFQLHWIRENNMYRVQGYKNIYEYAEKEYGIKKTSCTNFISIIENYAQRDENGDVVESIAECYKNYSASQLVAMLGMDEETKQQVTPDMSVRAINRMRKSGDGTDAGNLQKADTGTEKIQAPSAGNDNGNKDADRKTHDKADTQTAGAAHDDTVKSADRKPPAASDDAAQRAAAQDDEISEDTEEKSGRTLAEIDSYPDYRGMLDELDLMIKHAFAASASARVKIICVQG